MNLIELKIKIEGLKKEVEINRSRTKVKAYSIGVFDYQLKGISQAVEAFDNAEIDMALTREQRDLVREIKKLLFNHQKS